MTVPKEALPGDPTRPEPAELRVGRAQRDLLAVLRWRDDLGPCYLLPGERDLVRLWVPTMMTDRHYEPLSTLRARTIKAVIDAGLATIGAAVRSDDVPGMPPKRVVAPLRIAEVSHV